VALLLVLLALFGFVFAGVGSGSTSSSRSVQAQPVPAATVPSVTGSYGRYAVPRLRAAGLVPVQRRCRAPRAVEYMVARQSIAAGTVLPRGSRVRIFLVPALGSGVKHPPCNSFAPAQP
jgi:beta-lactam-binding protein with PASTA domain